jgi:hypothetical protein
MCLSIRMDKVPYLDLIAQLCVSVSAGNLFPNGMGGSALQANTAPIESASRI